MTDAEREAVAAAEKWFVAHGLPYFVHNTSHRVRGMVRLRALAPVGVVAVLVAVLAGVAVAGVSEDVWNGVAVGSIVLGLILMVYAFGALHMGSIARWAVGQTFGSLGWVFPLVTRALPLLLLFTTFLFINTEVWQVASSLERSLLWLTVLLFGSVAVVFLLARLPEEVRDVRAEAEGGRLQSLCAGTPVEEVAGQLGTDVPAVELTAMQRANLVLVLLFSQALQVLLLALAVFAFFIVFGNVAIGDEVIESWLGEGHPSALPSLDWMPVSNELFQVSVFLAAFSGLYFTVYAVTDQNYREQFFTSVSRELERAIGVATIYRALVR